MPPKPTCKVVKREGQRGARIDPKGCKVRTTKDAQGNKKKQNKQGQEKIKRTTTKILKDMRLAVSRSLCAEISEARPGRRGRWLPRAAPTAP